MRTEGLVRDSVVVAGLDIGRRGCAQSRQRALWRLHPEDGIHRAEEQGVLLQIRLGPAGMGGGRDDLATCGFELGGEFECEEQVGEFALSVGAAWLVASIVEVEVVEGHLARAMGNARHVDDATVARRKQKVQELTGQREVREVVDAELEFEALLGLAFRRNHHAGVVDQEVQTIEARTKRGGELPNLFEVGEIQTKKLDARIGKFAANVSEPKKPTLQPMPIKIRPR